MGSGSMPPMCLASRAKGSLTLVLLVLIGGVEDIWYFCVSVVWRRLDFDCRGGDGKVLTASCMKIEEISFVVYDILVLG